jgi:tRNA pseudouridine38-40 synthase
MGKYNYMMKISYVGTNYYGWQVQPNKPTIQGEIEKRLEVLFKEKIKIVGSGRTDAKVHALGQVANFKTDKFYPLDKLKKYLNSTLPPDIAILDVKLVPESFHARFSAKGKTYKYIISTVPDPFLVDRAWFIYREFDLNRIKDALNLIKNADCLISLSKGEKEVKRKVELRELNFNYDMEKLIFYFTASHFLRYMVRKIVGHVIQVGLGSMELDELKEIIEARDPKVARFIANPEGLYLKEVYYLPKDLELKGEK